MFNAAICTCASTQTSNEDYLQLELNALQTQLAEIVITLRKLEQRIICIENVVLENI